MSRALRLLVLLVALVLALAARLARGGRTPRATFNDVEDEVMCDVCGVPLNIAESPRADQRARGDQRLIAQGLTKQQIKDQLVGRVRPAILADPAGRRLRRSPTGSSRSPRSLAALVGARDRAAALAPRAGRAAPAATTPARPGAERRRRARASTRTSRAGVTA